MKSYTIWNEVRAVGGKKSPSHFGARESFQQRVFVGTSARNSHELAQIDVERHVDADGRATFILFIDGEPVKRGTLDGKRFTPLRVES